MTWTITNNTPNLISITFYDGITSYVVPKFRIHTEISGDLCLVYYVRDELASSWRRQLLSIDYNDVDNSPDPNPSSAAEVQTIINNYIVSEFGGATPGLPAVLGVDNDTDGNDLIIGTGDFLVVDDATPSEIAGFSASSELISLDTATYPDLTELAYVKGVTSAIQAQLNKRSRILDTQFALSTPNDTSENVVYSYEIPAGTLAVGDMIEIHFYGKKTSGSGNNSVRFYLHSSSATGGNQYGITQTATTNNQTFAPRIFINGASSQIGYPATAGILWGSIGGTYGSGTLSTASSIFVVVTNQKAVGADNYEFVAVATILHKKQ